MIFSLPVAARTSRIASMVASVPLIAKRTFSADGMSCFTSSAHCTSSSWQAP
jgi:hypothetical protein